MIQLSQQPGAQQGLVARAKALMPVVDLKPGRADERAGIRLVAVRH